MKEIPLTQGKVALVDDEDYDQLNKYKWHAYKDKKTWYARRYVCFAVSRQVNISMHRQIMNVKDPLLVTDHIDGNGLNNQRSNLRVATHYQNCANKKSTGRSKYLGVFLNTSTYKNRTYIYWQAAIQKDGVKQHLGVFKSEVDAALAYNKAAIETHGEFANLNKIPCGN